MIRPSHSAAKDAYSQTYREARDKFFAAAQAAGLTVESEVHPLKGRDGETLALDVVRDGPPDAQAVLLMTSACHGVEGFCGSGVQVALLRDAAWRALVSDSGVAVVYVHALNPHGFSWWRRVTNEGVDLNRNFQDFGQPLPTNAEYDALADALVPAQWPPLPDVQQVLLNHMQTHGPDATQAVITRGQYGHPQGLFFGGHAPTWSNLAVRRLLRAHASHCRRLGWIDLHTGLGPSGHGERIFASSDDAAALKRARAWWGDAVTSIYDGSSTSALLTGLMWSATEQECPQAEYTGIALEYGTVPMLEVIEALRGDHWLAGHPEADAALAAAIKQRIRNAFYTDTDAWKQQVLEQAFEAAEQGLRGLSG